MAEEEISPPELGEDSKQSLRLTEVGFSGNVLSTSTYFDRCKKDLRWPQAGKTYSEMATDSTIFPALFNFESMIARVPWEVEIPKGYEEELEEHKKYLEQVMKDMEHSWTQFIRNAATFNTYGFQVSEKVFRRRLKSKGSRFNDGLWGVKRLAPRPQDTITDWFFKSKGRDITHVVQQTYFPVSKSNGLYQAHNYIRDTQKQGTEVKIPRNKFLLFRNHGPTDTPWGYSPLAAVWEDWKYLKALKENEAVGISQDLRGLKVLTIPPQYLAEDATDGDKAVLDYYKRAMNAMNKGLQTGMILPGVRDDGGDEMFKFELLGMQGKAGYDVGAVIERYRNSILTALNASFLLLGNTGGGSYALSDNLLDVAKVAIESKLIEIQEVLNRDLVPQLFELNGWDTKVMPEFKFGEISQVDMETFTKGIQRIAATGSLYKSAGNINKIAEVLGLPDMVPEDWTFEKVQEHLSPETSRSGDGMATGGSGQGTGKTTNSNSNQRDNSTSNNDN